jgi:hypothetical protein
MFFIPVISFNLGRLLENFTLYRIPENNGKRRTGSVKAFTEYPEIKGSIKEMQIQHLKGVLILLRVLALSGVLIASSFKSVNLFSPYVLNVLKKATTEVFMENTLINNPEKNTLKAPPIAKKSDVEIRNDTNLSDTLENLDNICDVFRDMRYLSCIHLLEILCLFVFTGHAQLHKTFNAHD